MVKDTLKKMEAQKSEHPKAPSKLKQLIDTVTTKDDETKEEEEKKDPDLLTIEDIREQLRHVEKAVNTKEPRFMSRALRALVSLRRRINSPVLRTVLNGGMTPSAAYRKPLLAYLEEGMEVDSSPQRPKSSRQGSAVGPLPEVEIYLHLLVVLYLVDRKKLEQAVQCSESLIQKICAHNRRTLDMLAAKCYFYHCRCYELTGKLNTLRMFLHTRLRTCTLRNDHEGQATLMNLLLRNYLLYNLYDQAFKLVAKSSFPENASNNEAARHHYYLGRIKAMQLEYSSAHTHLLQAIRKAPQHAAVGFKQAVHKLAVTVELLLGDIPDRAVFRQPSLRKTLAPYFQLTKAVLMGNLSLFNQVLEKHAPKFQAEDTFTLIIRLRHNVIKTGVRMINQSYSRIYLSDVARKLGLDSSEDAEYIVAKAIRDGVIEATIDHEKGYMQARDVQDVYRTQEPMRAFHQRICFCLDIHNNSVRAMRFPPKSYNKDLESAEERREREQQELESAKEIAEDDFDGMM